MMKLSLWAAGAVAVAMSSLAVAAVPSRAAVEHADAGSDGGVKPPAPRHDPDPPALSEREQYVFDLRYDRGEVRLLSVHKTDLGAPRPTPRAMGRFALELYEGPTLIERVRFDFPMLGGPEADAGYFAPPRLEPNLRTRIGVLFPATRRGTRLELWDRARDIRWQMQWPPSLGPQADSTVDGGAAR